MIAAAVTILSLAVAPQSRERVLVTAAANARATPATDARVLCPLSMGQELELEAREGDWVRVTTCGGVTYVHASLVRTFTAATRDTVREALIRERLAREGEGFAAADALIGLVEAWGSQYQDPETRARYALYRMKAIARAASIGERGALRSRLVHILAESSPMFVYNEPAGSWMLRDEYIWQVYATHKDTAAADDIAWFAAENDLPGECEGYLPCHLAWTDRLQGEYLRRHPRGRHVEAAIDRVRFITTMLGDPPKTMFEGLPKSEVCSDLAKPLAPLRAAVAGSASARRAAALEELDRLAALCR